MENVISVLYMKSKWYHAASHPKSRNLPDAISPFLAPQRGFIEKFGKKCRQIILVGERMKAVNGKNISYARNLPEGLSKASEFAGGDDIILSSVKCFR